MLAGISSTWYTFLEQGRSVRASVKVLGRIADVLRLTDAERRHLATLVRISVAGAPQQPLPDGVQQVLDALGPCSAYILDYMFDTVACNDVARCLWKYDVSVPGRQRNVLRRLFTDATRRSLHVDWARATRVAVPISDPSIHPAYNHCVQYELCRKVGGLTPYCTQRTGPVPKGLTLHTIRKPDPGRGEHPCTGARGWNGSALLT